MNPLIRSRESGRAVTEPSFREICKKQIVLPEGFLLTGEKNVKDKNKSDHGLS